MKLWKSKDKTIQFDLDKVIGFKEEMFSRVIIHRGRGYIGILYVYYNGGYVQIGLENGGEELLIILKEQFEQLSGNTG